jgi:hypothetical protein
MYQSKNQSCEAFIAAVHSLENLPVWRKLKDYRKNNSLKSRDLNMNRCFCEGDGEDTVSSSSLFPIARCDGLENYGLYQPLPFFYLYSWTKSRVLPIVEVIEVPLFQKNGIFRLDELMNKDKETIDNSLFQLGTSYIVNSSQITRDNISNMLSEVRKKVIMKCFDMTSSISTIFFSTFCEFEKDFLLNDSFGYFHACENQKEKILGEYLSEKILPMKFQNKFYFFKMNSWALSSSSFKSSKI